MKSLVGYTGFVGSNLASSTKFDHYYNSKNIAEAYNTKPELLVYSGVRAQKYVANKNPEKDFSSILNAIDNIKKIKPKKIILISTIDVYGNPENVFEDTDVIRNGQMSYGSNRLYLEDWVENSFSDYSIVRLPGLYGKNIKKNFIYDLINIIPSMLSEEKYSDISKKGSIVSQFYQKNPDGFYKCIDLNNYEKQELRRFFKTIGFSALNFTDSRAVFQFYNLENLWEHIQIVNDNNIKKINLATEPVSVKDIYHSIVGSDFINETHLKPPSYNFKTNYSKLFNGCNDYIFNKDFILRDIKKFVQENTSETFNI